jgi:hypothetical protein
VNGGSIVRWRKGTIGVLLGAVSLVVWSAGGLSGETASSAAAKAKPRPPIVAPSGFCGNHIVTTSFAIANWKRFRVYETSGEARGLHFFKAFIDSSAFYCADGRVQVAYDFSYDLTNIYGTPILGQIRVKRADGTSRASPIFELKPRSVTLCCREARSLPVFNFPKPVSRVTSITVLPLFNAHPTVYSAGDTKGGLSAAYK